MEEAASSQRRVGLARDLAQWVGPGGVVAVCVGVLVVAWLPWIAFPADLLGWAEPGYLLNLMKLEAGVPLYGPPSDGNSVIYTPGSPLLTHAVLSLLGLPLTVPAARWVQVGYVAVATILAVVALRHVSRVVGIQAPRTVSIVVASMVLLLAATSPQVNRYVLTLHADALALAVSMLIWVALLGYLRAPSVARALALGLLPAAGFVVKQFLVAWLPLVGVAILVGGPAPVRERVRHALVFGATGAVLVLASVAAMRAAWGADFQFWVFEIMGGSRRRLTLAGEFNIALLRSVDHLLRAWWELSIGFAGFWAAGMLQPRREVFALALAWAGLVAAEALSSGSGWAVLYHFGPAALIGTATFLAVMPALVHAASRGLGRWTAVGEVAAATLVTASLLSALRVLPTRDGAADRVVPPRGPSDALRAQVAAIESEVAQSPDRVLLDFGNWVYLPSRLIARDRAEALGDQPPGGHYDSFVALLARIEGRHYDKVLVHAFDDDAFLYDWARWPRPSGVRAALQRHYTPLRIIPGSRDARTMFNADITVLVPVPGSTAPPDTPPRTAP